ncbi:Rab family, other [Angomonas deanei]|nr:Rab family, other [Angomonas deanei]|eukprot:EPY41179.1 Rab family, other [Angomonas deanei]
MDQSTTPDLPSVKHKIVLLGDQSVGKTSIITRFMYDTFEGQYNATIGIDFASKTVYMEKEVAPEVRQTAEGEPASQKPKVVAYNARLHVWDTAGQERFRSLIPSYIRNSAATIVVYDIASRDSFLSSFRWIDDVRAERGSEVVVMLVGNKKDLAVDGREVSAEEAQKKAESYNCLFTEVSAKTGAGIKAMFRQVAAALPAPDLTDQDGDGTGGNGNNSANQNRTSNPFLVTPSTMRETDAARQALGNRNTGGVG